VILDRRDKHSVWVNSQALARAGLTAAAPDPPGGEILRTGKGDLLGILTGSAIKLVRSLAPVAGEEKLRQDLLRAQAEFLAFGVTGGMEASTRLRELAVMKRAAEEGLLKLRLRAMLYAGTNEDQEYLAAGGRLENWSADGRLIVVGVKIIADGSLGSRSAWLLSDYADRPGHRGQPGYSDEELTALMVRARRHGLQVAVHAIGDAGVRQTLAAMGRALGPEPGDHRWRIEHFQVVSEEDRDLALALGVIPSIQAAGLMADLDLAEERLGPAALARSYRWREILDRGGILAGGSDAPIESANPFVGIYAAVTRQNLEGRPPGGWRPADRLTRLEALKSYTTWAARAIFAENRQGSLAPGRLADFIVLDRDPLTCPEAELKAVEVLKTVIGGEVVFER
jgi:predicted amidohydrolase YtcJ